MSSSHRTKPEVPKKKIVAVGDPGVGKTRMLIRFHSGEFHEYFMPTFHDNYTEDVHLDRKRMEIVVWDTPGHEEYDRLRPLTYPETDVFLICFSVDDMTSFENVEVKWVPEVLHFRSNARVPYLLVGCRSDLRRDRKVIESFRKAGLEFITSEKADSLAQSIGAVMYLECSAVTGEGVSEVFEQATRAALSSQKSKNPKSCLIL
ncbi:GTP-binding protein Rho1 [Serendipita sp. 407]|nr:GTP-binding protein Rho1 [Serendipita sp. 407]